MGQLYRRISLMVRAELNHSKRRFATDSFGEGTTFSEKLLEQAIIAMQEDLLQLRQAVARRILTQKRTEQQYNKSQTEANNWHNHAQLALTKGDETLAREALTRKKAVAEAAATLKGQLDAQRAQVDTLKKTLIALESKISLLKARAAAAKANEQLQGTIGRMGTGSAMAAFERMEDKVLEMEARSQASYELAGNELEQQFKMLESGSDVDDELVAMKAQLAGDSVSQPPLPVAGEKKAASADPAVDAELEALRQLIDNL